MVGFLLPVGLTDRVNPFMKKIHIALLVASFIIPSVSFASIDTNLKYGSRGLGVTELQDFLIDKGFLLGQSSGNFFSLTRKAVVAYQTSVGLPATGFVGAMTRAKINDDLSSANASAVSAEITETGTMTTHIDTSSTANTLAQENTATFAPGCSSAVGFSPTTGKACAVVAPLLIATITATATSQPIKVNEVQNTSASAVVAPISQTFTIPVVVPTPVTPSAPVSVLVKDNSSIDKKIISITNLSSEQIAIEKLRLRLSSFVGKDGVSIIPSSNLGASLNVNFPKSLDRNWEYPIGSAIGGTESGTYDFVWREQWGKDCYGYIDGSTPGGCLRKNTLFKNELQPNETINILVYFDPRVGGAGTSGLEIVCPQSYQLYLDDIDGSIIRKSTGENIPFPSLPMKEVRFNDSCQAIQ